MEYSKEDLMEAKRQILGVGENMGTEESKKIWEKNAQFWDNAMGDKSNEFHREVVRPKVTELLSPNPADYILDIACGNGNYSSYLAQRGASIVAFDYSKKMIELAKRRQSQYAKQIEFCVADATNRESILELKRNRAFTKAVSNMAIMDITDIEPLLMAVYELLWLRTSLEIVEGSFPRISPISLNLRLSRSDTSIVCLSSNVRCAFFAMVVSPLVGCHPEIC